MMEMIVTNFNHHITHLETPQHAVLTMKQPCKEWEGEKKATGLWYLQRTCLHYYK